MSPRKGMKMPRLIRAALLRAGVDNPERVSSGVDVIGDIAIVRLEGFTQREKKKVGRTLMEEMKNVRAIFDQVGGIEGEHRLRKLNHLSGERRTLTTHRENGCVFRVDVAKCYFSPRLSTERLRIAELVGPKEKVLNMFAGVGPFSVPIAKLAGARVTSCEINEYAARLHGENNTLNKVDGLVSVFAMDADELPGRSRAKYDRVLMPHPSQANKFLQTALSVARKGGVIHYYRHVVGRDEVEAKEALRAELLELLPTKSKCAIRRVREIGPRWLEMAAEIRVRA
ncbi:MAG TPA: class I SAM-dependent methyltransferase family protein [Nitrososphaerales archaeon]|nr:class I SAM-dependent methyltransferase family protein [Nitrososphaerales archaeon]